MNSEIFHLPLGPLGPEDAKAAGPSSLPKAYGEDTFILLPRDPNWIFAFWELSPKKAEEAAKVSKQPGATALIQLYFSKSGKPALEVPCDLKSLKFYLKAPISGESYYAELGVKHSGRPFSTLLKSNTVTLPYGYPADATRPPAPEIPGCLTAFTRR